MVISLTSGSTAVMHIILCALFNFYFVHNILQLGIRMTEFQ